MIICKTNYKNNAHRGGDKGLLREPVTHKVVTSNQKPIGKL